MLIEFEIGNGVVLIGTIGLENCVLKRCRFRGLTFAGPKGIYDKFSSSFPHLTSLPASIFVHGVLMRPSSTHDKETSPPSPTS